MGAECLFQIFSIQLKSSTETELIYDDYHFVGRCATFQFDTYVKSLKNWFQIFFLTRVWEILKGLKTIAKPTEEKIGAERIPVIILINHLLAFPPILQTITPLGTLGCQNHWQFYPKFMHSCLEEALILWFLNNKQKDALWNSWPFEAVPSWHTTLNLYKLKLKARQIQKHLTRTE